MLMNSSWIVLDFQKWRAKMSFLLQVTMLPRLGRLCTSKKVMSTLSTLSSHFSIAGRRYRRHDEIGTPYCITVDHQTIQDQTVTVRERDSMTQVRVHVSKILEQYGPDLCRPSISFEPKLLESTPHTTVDK
eukprot:TRINITY_DN2080_c0_g1_i2.p1 TRINITY_DN2080_c0_g1~~TRINITY_DN2080_c0_g1_i2.p1  ORF type:complete len:131 (+),score=20.45 TRINITY_DN2080_c0_g1_i2:104-496(+)